MGNIHSGALLYSRNAVYKNKTILIRQKIMNQPIHNSNTEQEFEHSQVHGVVIGNQGDRNVQVNGEGNILNFQISREETTSRELIVTSPYKGLKRFNFGDKDLFFGRDRLISTLLEVVEQNSLSLVLGASGSGKSSLIRAGLIPKWKQSLESQISYDFIFTPDRDPFDSLYRCLVAEEKDYDFGTEAEIAFEAKADTLTKVINNLRKDEEHWLIFVDQFEELFTICDDREKRDNFIAGVVQLAQSNNSFVKIVLAMRADFFEKLGSYPDLGAIINQNNIHLVTDMHSDELRLAIEQPAFNHGVVFEEGLVEQIITEVKEQKGYLPLLQYTLNLLWETECLTRDSNGRPHIEDRTLNKISYFALEGVRGALQKHINKIYQNLNQEEKRITKHIFVKLVNITNTDSGSRTVSRRAYRDEFIGESIEKTLNRFIDENLLVSNCENSTLKFPTVNNNQKKLATVEIAHEILLSSWDTFKTWIEEEKEAIILKNWLATETKRWQKVCSQDEYKARQELLKGSRLEQIVELRKKDAFQNVGGLTPGENQFIDLSVTQTERLEKEKEEQRQRQLKHERKARQAAQKTTIMTVIAAPILTVLLIMVGINRRATQVEKIRNLNEASKALMASNQPFDALSTSLQAAKKLNHLILPPSELRKQVSQTIQQALMEDVKEYNRIEGGTDDITSVYLNPDSNMIATASYDGTVKLWSMDGKELKTLPHDEEVARVIFSPNDAQTIATVITDATKRTSKMFTLWSQDGKKLKTLPYNGYPENVIFSPDGQMLATLGNNRDVTLRSKNGEKIKSIPNNTFVSDVNFSPDSKKIAIVSRNNVKLWNQQSKELKTFDHSRVSKVSFSPDNQMIATTSFNNNVKLWSIDGKPLPSLPHEGSVYNVNFSPDSQKIVTKDYKGVVRIWDKNGEEPKILAHDKGISIVRFSSDKQRIATVSKEKIVKLWDYNGKLLKTLTGHQSAINSINFSADGKMIATASNDKTVKLWNLNGQELQTLQHYNLVKDVSFSPDSKTIVSVSQDNTVRFWDFDALKFKNLQSHQKPVNLVKFSQDGKTIATASHDGKVKLWNQDGQKRNTLKGFGHWTYDISFSPDGKMIATGGHEGVVRLWSIDGKPLEKLGRVNFHAIGSLSFSPNSQTIAIGRFDGQVEIWSREGEKIKDLSGHKGIVGSISFSPNGQILATAARDRTIKIWNIENKELKTTLKGHKDDVLSVSFSPDGKTITSVSKDGEIKLWNIDGKELKTTRYDNVFESVSFHPSGKIIATTSGDNTVQIWSYDGKELETLKGHDDGIMSISFSPDGKTLATASQDKSVILWNLGFNQWGSMLNKNLDELMVDACDVVGNYLKNKSEKNSNPCDRVPSTATTKVEKKTELARQKQP